MVRGQSYAGLQGFLELWRRLPGLAEETKVVGRGQNPFSQEQPLSKGISR